MATKTTDVLGTMRGALEDLKRKRRDRAGADTAVTKAETIRSRACEAEAVAERAYASARAAVQQAFPDASRT